MTREERDKVIRILQWLHDNKFLFRSTEEDVKYATKLAIQELLQESKVEKIIKMRDATPEERESIDKYIKSISKPTGVEFDEEQEQLDFVQPHKSISVKLKVIEPCEEMISRQSAISLASDLKQDLPDDEHMADMVMAYNEGILEY